MATVPSEITESVRRFIDQLQKEKHVTKAYLYGSHARGSAGKWSDIDLAIVSPDFSEDLFAERVLLMKLALSVDDRLEPSPFRPDDFTRDNPLVNEISKTGIELNCE
ncbi:nucleotidyltransferase domain-containing protein [Desulfonatronospira sp.]|uniref:nucleotidyltransferase domain-containing protein n=1 Tax=Desulfonatronospira sp. TaxID=1962951 RepID=UPI0025BE6AF0|nr:nucleotidyltransferase domain-containing protein [Desulfonatronospira sp.]